MYRCEDCGEFFEEPYIVKDDPSPAGVSLTQGYYYWQHCPYCGSDHIEEADRCASCGEPIEKYKTLCPNCQSDLLISLAELAEEMGITTDDLMYAIEEL